MWPVDVRSRNSIESLSSAVLAELGALCAPVTIFGREMIEMRSRGKKLEIRTPDDVDPSKDRPNLSIDLPCDEAAIGNQENNEEICQ
jgi:hypothetical protein